MKPSVLAIKMILTDLDATLLRDDKTISDYTRNVIQQVRDQGIKFVPATARAMRVLNRLEIPKKFSYDGLVILNGSRIVVDDTVIYEQGINPEERQEVLTILLEKFPNQRITVEIDDIMYANHNLSEVDPHEVNYVITDFSDCPNQTATRIIMNLPSLDDYSKLEACLPDYMYVHNIEGTPLCRILHRSVSKAEAINHLCNLWGFDPYEIVCFGDDSNDVEMFEYCGTSVAMENAIDAVKQRASDHTESNNNDGVARWIEKNILL